MSAPQRRRGPIKSLGSQLRNNSRARLAVSTAQTMISEHYQFTCEAERTSHSGHDPGMCWEIGTAQFSLRLNTRAASRWSGRSVGASKRAQLAETPPTVGRSPGARAEVGHEPPYRYSPLGQTSIRGDEVALGVADRHPTRAERDDHPIQMIQPTTIRRDQHRTNVPARSRRTATLMSPTSVDTVFVDAPFRHFGYD